MRVLAVMSLLLGRHALAQEVRSPDEQIAMEVFTAVAPASVFVTQAKLQRKRLSRTPTLVPAGTGSGFVWDSAGHVVTNYHVIDGGQAFVVTLHDTTTREARVVGVDPATDLAVLRIVNPPSGLVSVALPEADVAPQVGQMALAIGNPYGLDHTLTVGTVSAVGREIPGYGGVSIRGMIQTDASINHGNSGGPLLDSWGRLLGVNTMMYSESGSSAGIGFAVPVSTVQRVVPQLIAAGKVQRMRIGVAMLSASVSRRAGISGVIIERVEENSPAAAAGLVGLSIERGRLKLGDVILAVDSVPVRSPDDLYHALESRQDGEVVSLKVLRAGREETVPVTLQAR